jgi:hypothetical protein
MAESDSFTVLAAILVLAAGDLAAMPELSFTQQPFTLLSLPGGKPAAFCKSLVCWEQMAIANTKKLM